MRDAEGPRARGEDQIDQISILSPGEINAYLGAVSNQEAACRLEDSIFGETGCKMVAKV